MTDNARLENVPPSLEVVRISNHILKEMIEANSQKNRSKVFQPSKINHVVCWIKTTKTLSQIFSKLEMLFNLLRHCFSTIFCTFHVMQIVTRFSSTISLTISLAPWHYNLHVSLRRRYSRFVVVLLCAYFQKTK